VINNIPIVVCIKQIIFSIARQQQIKNKLVSMFCPADSVCCPILVIICLRTNFLFSISNHWDKKHIYHYQVTLLTNFMCFRLKQDSLCLALILLTIRSYMRDITLIMQKLEGMKKDNSDTDSSGKFNNAVPK
jgi:hypothetical protein